jgi:hypothetical protein
VIGATKIKFSAGKIWKQSDKTDVLNLRADRLSGQCRTMVQRCEFVWKNIQQSAKPFRRKSAQTNAEQKLWKWETQKLQNSVDRLVKFAALLLFANCYLPERQQ